MLVIEHLKGLSEAVPLAYAVAAPFQAPGKDEPDLNKLHHSLDTFITIALGQIASQQITARDQALLERAYALKERLELYSSLVSSSDSSANDSSAVVAEEDPLEAFCRIMRSSPDISSGESGNAFRQFLTEMAAGNSEQVRVSHAEGARKKVQDAACRFVFAAAVYKCLNDFSPVESPVEGD